MADRSTRSTTKLFLGVGCFGVVALIALIVGAWMVATSKPPLADLHRDLQTTIRLPGDPIPPDPPPVELFELVQYPAPLGDNWAYISPVQSGRRPGLVYVAGGLDWGISANAWTAGPWENDQSGMAFTGADIVVMRPSLRGANGNPGTNECLFGEVRDVIAAAEYLAARPDVDPERIYLVGHSTGATMAALAAELSQLFRAVFPIGPATSAADYGDECVPLSASRDEVLARSPGTYIENVTTPMVMIEGENPPSNADALRYFASQAGPSVSFVIVPGLDHFSVLAPASHVIADVIVADTDPAVRVAVTEAAIAERADQGPPPQCRTRVLEGTVAQTPAAWVDREAGQWPQMVLTNFATFDGHSSLRGASAFLLRAPDDTVLLATAAHLMGTAGGVEPSLWTEMASPELFDAVLRTWVAHPRTQPEVQVVAAGLADPFVGDDWLLSRVEEPTPASVEVLRLATTPAKVGDPVFLVGCPYAERDCRQNVYAGRVLRAEGTWLRYTLDPPVEVSGFSGGPILNARGEVVGVFSMREPPVELGDGRDLEGGADTGLVHHVQRCAELHASGNTR